MFTITFSLSMGYEVFLLSRVRGNGAAAAIRKNDLRSRSRHFSGSAPSSGSAVGNVPDFNPDDGGDLA